ncbi:MAG TPA: hypothetical protein VGH33_02405 [Isosphaeraceae bacterium]|jgi:hypothetical protein
MEEIERCLAATRERRQAGAADPVGTCSVCMGPTLPESVTVCGDCELHAAALLHE